MKLYKLTDQDGYTRRGEYNQCKWGPAVSHSGTGTGNLCGPGWIHAYTSPHLAVLLNPIHANINRPRLWEAVGVVEKNDNGLKVGCKTLTTLREIPLPEWTTRKRVLFAIACTEQALGSRVLPGWNRWANAFKAGKADSHAAAACDAARAAARAAAHNAAADSAAYAAARDAAYAAACDAASYAARAAAHNAAADSAAYAAAHNAAYAARAAARAAYAAAHNAARAAYAAACDAARAAYAAARSAAYTSCDLEKAIQAALINGE